MKRTFQPATSTSQAHLIGFQRLHGHLVVRLSHLAARRCAGSLRLAGAPDSSMAVCALFAPRRPG